MKSLRPAMAILFVLVLVPALSGAQDATGPTIERAEQGPYLVDAEGRSLYMYLRDDPGASACNDRCAENWPPVTVEGEPAFGDRVIGAHVGTLEREDGSTQATYGGWPLYRYAHDDEPGETFGHGLGDVFYLVSPSGTRIEGQVPEDAEAAQGDDAQADDAEAAEGGEEAAADPRMEQGQQIYASNCTSCHGTEGQGVVGPGFVGNGVLENARSVVTTILFGRPDHGMPPFEDQLDDEQVAAVATYIRNAWGNDFGPVSPDLVSELR